MKKTKIIQVLVIIAVLILEILPYGAVLSFMGDPEANVTIRYTYSYFDMTPFGYANFAPFITALLTCVLTVLLLIALHGKAKLKKAIAAVSVIAAIVSVTPILYGTDYFTLVGALITAGLTATAILSFTEK